MGQMGMDGTCGTSCWFVCLVFGFKRAVEQVTVVLESGQMREIKGILNAAIGAGLRGSSGPVAAGGFIRLSNIMVAV